MTESRRRIPIEYREQAEADAAYRAAAAESDSGERPISDPGPPPSGPGPAGRGDGGPGNEASQEGLGGQAGPDALAEDERLAALAAERDEYLDGLQRLKADFENYRRRSRREMDEAEARARGRLLVVFLPVLDNLSRALDAAEHHEEGKVLEGVRLTHGQFLGLLASEGVTEVCPLGDAFDPQVHEAMMTQPSDQPEGTVVGVLERGYVMGDRVLRPARVAVSSGPPAEEG